MKLLCCTVALSFLLFPGQGLSQPLIPLLSPADAVIAIDLDQTARSNHPAGENPPKVIDGLIGTKYLNFGHQGSGFIVTPASAIAVESFQIRTANDAPGRDPGTWELYGFNGTLVSTNNSSGLDEPWTLIDSGDANLPGDPLAPSGDPAQERGVLGPLTAVNSGGVAYEHYKMVFPSLKDLARANSMQIDEVQFFADAGGTSAILAPANPIIAVHFGFESRYPFGERPALALDDNPATKYLNFGKANSGLIVTREDGPARADFMRLTTANDFPGRDPASYELWGTNDPIQSRDNGDGLGGEVWTLISSGPLSLPDTRFDDSTLVPIHASALYESYKLIFTSVKDPDGAGVNSMQIAGVQLYMIPEPSCLLLTLVGCGALVARIRPRRTHAA